jgi:hypothetical protein
MSKIVLVETVSSFRHVYAIEVADNSSIECALDDVVMESAEEMAQNHISEDIFSYRQITEEEYLKIFDEENDYLKECTTEKKLAFIHRVMPMLAG